MLGDIQQKGPSGPLGKYFRQYDQIPKENIFVWQPSWKQAEPSSYKASDSQTQDQAGNVCSLSCIISVRKEQKIEFYQISSSMSKAA